MASDFSLETNAGSGYAKPIDLTEQDGAAHSDQTKIIRSSEYDRSHHSDSNPGRTNSFTFDPNAPAFVPSFSIPDAGYAPLYYPSEHNVLEKQFPQASTSTSHTGILFSNSTTYDPPLCPPHASSCDLGPTMPHSSNGLPAAKHTPFFYDSHNAATSCSGQIAVPDERTGGLMPLATRATVTTKELRNHISPDSLNPTRPHFSPLHRPLNAIPPAINGFMSMATNGEYLSSGGPPWPMEQLRLVDSEASGCRYPMTAATTSHVPNGAYWSTYNSFNPATTMAPSPSFHSAPWQFSPNHPSTTQIPPPPQHQPPLSQPYNGPVIQIGHPIDDQYRQLSLKSSNNAIPNSSNTFSLSPKGIFAGETVMLISSPPSAQMDICRDRPFSQTQSPNEFLQALYPALRDRCIRGQPEAINGSPTSIEIRRRLSAHVQCPPISAEEAGKSMYISFISKGVCLFCFKHVGAKEERCIGHVRAHMDHRAFTCTYTDCKVCPPDQKESFFSYERLKDHIERQRMTTCPHCLTTYRRDNRSRHRSRHRCVVPHSG